MKDDQDQEAGESETKNLGDDITTPTAGDGQAGTEDILHGHVDMVESRYNPENCVACTRLISGYAVSIEWTTEYPEDVHQCTNLAFPAERANLCATIM